MQASIEDIKDSLLARPDTSKSYKPSISEYASNMPMLTYSMWTFLSALQELITVISTKAALADSTLLNMASTEASTASTNMTNALTADNLEIQEIADDTDDPNQANDLAAAQAQFSTDQASYGVAVTDYQGVVQSSTQSLQTLMSSAAQLVSMGVQIIQSVWMPAAS